MDAIQKFRDAMTRRGIVPPDEIIADGMLHRADADGKHGRGDAAYLLHLDGMPAGGFENHRDGGGWENWRADTGRPLNHAAQAAHRAKIEAAQAQRQADDAKRKTDARERAALIWAESGLAAKHPYLTRKKIHPHGARLYNGRLVLPLRDADGKLCNLQFIAADGTKRFLPGGQKRGCYYAIGKPDGILCVAEGYATAASIHEATGYAVAVAFDAGNLLPVAKALRGKYPDMTIVVCVDDDWKTEGNPGLVKAREAAQEVGGVVAIPVFEGEREAGWSDFNDMMLEYGADAVKAVIHAALTGDTPTEQPATEAANELKAPAGSMTTSNPAPEPPESVDIRILELAELSPVQYERVRETEAKSLKIRVSVLDNLVAQKRQNHQTASGIQFGNVEPWHEAIDGAALLEKMSCTIRRFIVCNEETAHAAALWCAMTWFMDVVQIAPLAVITAPEKRCGKSQLLFLLGKMVCRPLSASNISPAALFRVIDAWQPTLLLDEADAFMRENEELRGLLNSGHTRDSAYCVRVVGDEHEPKQFSTWSAKVIAGIGHLADTLMDRSIVLELRRKMPNENVERLRHAEPGLFEELTAKLARFANDNREAIRRSRPDLPSALHDRAQDNWEPLLAIADVAGGEWPELARHAALTLSGSSDENGSIGSELLADIREILETKRLTKISTADLIKELCGDDEKPWSTYNRGNPIKPRQIAKRLGEYGIRSKNIRVNAYEINRGFDADQFKEAFARYLSPATPQNIRYNATKSDNPSVHAGFDVADCHIAYATENNYPLHATQNVADKTLRSGYENASATLKPAPLLDCSVVADKTGGGGEDKGDEIIEVLI